MSYLAFGTGAIAIAPPVTFEFVDSFGPMQNDRIAVVSCFCGFFTRRRGRSDCSALPFPSEELSENNHEYRQSPAGTIDSLS
jgi:hypothetical protein